MITHTQKNMYIYLVQTHTQHMITYVIYCWCLFHSDLDPAVVMPKDSDVIQEIVMLNGESLTVACNAPSSSKTDTVWYKVCTY